MKQDTLSLYSCIHWTTDATITMMACQNDTLPYSVVLNHLEILDYYKYLNNMI